MLSKNIMATVCFLSFVSAPASAGLCDLVISITRQTFNGGKPMILNYDFVKNQPDQGRDAIVAAAAIGSHQPPLSSNQRRLIGRNIHTGKDILFVMENGQTYEESIFGLPLNRGLSKWKSLKQIGLGTYVLENGDLLQIKQEDEDEGGRYYTNLLTLDFDPKHMTSILDKIILSSSSPLKKLALIENRSRLIQELLEGNLRMSDITGKLSTAVSQKNFLVYVLIQSTRYPNSGWADLIMRVESLQKVGKAYSPLRHKPNRDSLLLDDGSVYEIENENYD